MKVFATNHDMGGAQAMVPALKELVRRGHEVIAFSVAEAPAYKVFLDAGLATKNLDGFDFDGPLTESKMIDIVMDEDPQVILVGISSPGENSSEKLALDVAIKLIIPSAVIIEAWPHLYLANYRDRDFPLYSQADQIMVFDEISKAAMIKAGFKAEQVTVTGVPSNDQLGSLKAKKAEVRREFREEFGISQSALLFTYAVTMNVNPGELDITKDDPRYMGFDESDVVCEFLKAAQEASSAREVRAIVRIKPGRDPEPFKKFSHELFPGTLVLGSECRDGNRVICASDCMVGTVTIMLQTSAFLDTLPISYLPNLNREDPQIANVLGVVKPLYKEGSLRNFMLGLAKGEIQPETELEKLAKVVIREDATQKVADCIESLW